MSLKIGGFQKNTLIDFPGVVASLVFTQGCNFRCPYCHNPSLISLPILESSTTYNISTLPNNSNFKLTNNNLNLIDESEIFAFLKKRKGLIDGVTITGGEPTLQPALESFCFKLKNMGFKVKVDTNGSRPDVIENLIKRELVDFIAMDIKSNKEGYKYLVGASEQIGVEEKIDIKNYKNSNKHALNKTLNFSLIIKSIKLIIKHSPAYEFRTTCVKPFITPEIMPEIGEMIKGASKYVLQHCSKNVKMFNPLFFQKNNPYPDPFLSDDELAHIRLIMKPYVQECSIR
ncbi:MAG: anaerobic ribonucleoside-triphosphate reductase activating protein [Desulfamplus sp.]|nr:anaerobic ribonucleoside-triphosphate reductase activating protein [Desulfamplus sp.]